MQDEQLFVPENSQEPEVKIDISQFDATEDKSLIPDFEFTPPTPKPPAPSQANDTNPEK